MTSANDLYSSTYSLSGLICRADNFDWKSWNLRFKIFTEFGKLFFFFYSKRRNKFVINNESDRRSNYVISIVPDFRVSRIFIDVRSS